jgi:hypothetical protein
VALNLAEKRAIQARELRVHLPLLLELCDASRVDG